MCLRILCCACIVLVILALPGTPNALAGEAGSRLTLLNTFDVTGEYVGNIGGLAPGEGALYAGDIVSGEYADLVGYHRFSPRRRRCYGNGRHSLHRVSRRADGHGAE